MADTYTTNLNLTKPEPGAAEDTWGISLNSDLDTLDAIFSSSGTQVNLNPNQVNFADNKKAIFGTGADLQIYHDGTHSVIDDVGTGNLILQTNGTQITLQSSSEYFVTAQNNGAVTLYHNGSTKLATTSTGVDVTGTVVSDGLTVEGLSLASETTAFNTTANSSNVSLKIGNSDTTSGSGNYKGALGFTRGDTNQIRSAIVGKQTDTSANRQGLAFLVHPNSVAGTLNEALLIKANNDIVFYDDTGTTQGLFWDSSAESLGIGTTSPAVAIHAQSSTAEANRSLRIAYDGTYYFDLRQKGAGGIVYNAVNASSGGHRWQLDGSEKARIDSSGNLLVGKTSVAFGTAGSVSYATGLLTATVDGNACVQLNRLTSDGVIQTFGKDGTTVGSIEAATNTNTDISIGSDNVRLLFFTNGSAIVPRASSNASADNTIDLGNSGNRFKDLYLSGSASSVGGEINTNSGSNPLYVTRQGNTNESLKIHVSDSAAIFESIQDETADNYGAFIFAMDDGVTEPFFDIRKGTASSGSKFYVDGSGSVGIGTSSPTSLVHAKGEQNGTNMHFMAEDTSSGNKGGFWVGNSDLSIEVDSAGAIGASDIRFVVDGSEMSRITSSGNFGIGTTAPSSQLNIKGTTGLLVESNGSANYGVYVQSNYSETMGTIGALSQADAGRDGASISFNDYGRGIVFKTNEGASNAEAARFDSSGNFGIGTSSPSQLLHLSSSNPTIQFTDTDTGADCFIRANTSTGALKIEADENNEVANSAIQFDVDGTERLRIDANGKLGVNTTSLDGILTLKQLANSDSNGLDGIRINASTGTTYAGFGLANATGTLAITAGDAGGTEDTEIVFKTASSGSESERARIDSSGQLLIGKTATDNTTVGTRINGTGFISSVADGDNAILLNRLTSDGSIITFRKDGTTKGNIGSVDSANGVQIYIASGNSSTSGVGLRFVNVTTSNYIAPVRGDGSYLDDTVDLGASSVRFDDIYATNGTIQTSDRNEKQDIQELSDAEQRVATACKGLIRRYKFNKAVLEKGDDARYHFGIIAQDLQDAFTAEGLDAGDYGMFISDTYTDDNGIEQTRLGVRYNELLAFIIATL